MNALFWFRAWFRTKTMSYILRQDAYNHSQSVLLLLLPMIFIDLLRRSLGSQPMRIGNCSFQFRRPRIRLAVASCSKSHSSSDAGAIALRRRTDELAKVAPMQACYYIPV